MVSLAQPLVNEIKQPWGEILNIIKGQQSLVMFCLRKNIPFIFFLLLYVEVDSSGRGRIMSTTDEKAVVKHIKSIVQPIRGTKRVFDGVDGLIQATKDGLLRRGQIIFGTSTAAHGLGRDDTQVGNVLNYLTPVLTAAVTGQPRSYLYFHVAVYAGQHNGVHYVIENGGGYE